MYYYCIGPTTSSHCNYIIHCTPLVSKFRAGSEAATQAWTEETSASEPEPAWTEIETTFSPFAVRIHALIALLHY